MRKSSLTLSLCFSFFFSVLSPAQSSAQILLEGPTPIIGTIDICQQPENRLEVSQISALGPNGGGALIIQRTKASVVNGDLLDVRFPGSFSNFNYTYPGGQTPLKLTVNLDFGFNSGQNASLIGQQIRYIRLFRGTSLLSYGLCGTALSQCSYQVPLGSTLSGQNPEVVLSGLLAVQYETLSGQVVKRVEFVLP